MRENTYIQLSKQTFLLCIITSLTLAIPLETPSFLYMLLSLTAASISLAYNSTLSEIYKRQQNTLSALSFTLKACVSIVLWVIAFYRLEQTTWQFGAAISIALLCYFGLAFKLPKTFSS